MHIASKKKERTGKTISCAFETCNLHRGSVADTSNVEGAPSLKWAFAVQAGPLTVLRKVSFHSSTSMVDRPHSSSINVNRQLIVSTLRPVIASSPVKAAMNEQPLATFHIYL
jgi:hypothetical protein